MKFRGDGLAAVRVARSWLMMSNMTVVPEMQVPIHTVL